jgi:hypothetical protein
VGARPDRLRAPPRAAPRSPGLRQELHEGPAMRELVHPWSKTCHVQTTGAATMTHPRVTRPQPPCAGHVAPRSSAAKVAFRKKHPCPGGLDRGSTRRCRGYTIDHVCPLACCGLDAPQNMQWQALGRAEGLSSSTGISWT